MILQNALKVFATFPKDLIDIVKDTDPTTVTQHGLYMRPLTDPSNSSRADPESEEDSRAGAHATPASSEVKMGKGRITLLGDAAHTTIPNGT